jgi:hypothetical protein
MRRVRPSLLLAGLVTVAAAGCDVMEEPNASHQTTNHPKSSAEGPTRHHVKIELQVPEDDPYGVVIILNDKQNFGDDFDRLRSALADLRDRGLPPDHLVLISPWMSCDQKWVLKVFDAAIAARFTNIHFAVPYGPKEE